MGFLFGWPDPNTLGYCERSLRAGRRGKVIESLSKRRFCQHGRQPEVNRVVIDGE